MSVNMFIVTLTSDLKVSIIIVQGYGKRQETNEGLQNLQNTNFLKAQNEKTFR